LGVPFEKEWQKRKRKKEEQKQKWLEDRAPCSPLAVSVEQEEEVKELHENMEIALSDAEEQLKNDFIEGLTGEGAVKVAKEDISNGNFARAETNLEIELADERLISDPSTYMGAKKLLVYCKYRLASACMRNCKPPEFCDAAGLLEQACDICRDITGKEECMAKIKQLYAVSIYEHGEFVSAIAIILPSPP
jgi:hypothetical protein